MSFVVKVVCGKLV
ncbi:hypothetical protein M2G36_21895 [Vibrio vulnificus]|nr:hypothetical protein [Vibrio vulnificus]MCG6264682.1 hypothetical protein [Vibrio vulnificus]MCG6299723.1 hypothetical protein [Vibrio vulnificus]MCG9655584.1 hypothetical protein [Vibrio vulnificus]MCG9655610.1 hypothetical protein [Vibrio vulnificus]